MGREVADFSVICNRCGSKWDSKAEWLERDGCMPERVGRS